MPEPVVVPPPIVQPLPPFLQEFASSYPALSTAVFALGLAIIAWVAFEVTHRYVLQWLYHLGQRTTVEWDDALVKRGFFRLLGWAVPLLIVRAGLPYLPALGPGVTVLLQRTIVALIVVVAALAITAFIRAFGDVYEDTPYAATKPIKSYTQALHLIVFALTLIFLFGVIFGRNPLLVLSSVGAASAILLLVFRDSLLSLVAGMQLTANDHIRVGDWIEMPQFMADGTVIDVALNTVKVQNWDLTFTIIPAHRFLEDSFKNWRGMESSGGRRIERCIFLDMKTIRFLTPAEIEDLRRFAIMREYFDAKLRDIAEWTTHNPLALEHPVNSRRLTNIGTFRHYVIRYLKSRPDIHQAEHDFIIRQLEPTPTGLPLEIYVFVKDTKWAVFENIQSDIFDHLLAIVPEFGLRVFQSPSGWDVTQPKGSSA
ncbi:MAG TPA: mechanosensitive ion channel family protein [Trueperaceae bacterium]|nr:mechanosensitive ion channel family protein [Trueperaceae bacterium]